MFRSGIYNGSKLPIILALLYFLDNHSIYMYLAKELLTTRRTSAPAVTISNTERIYGSTAPLATDTRCSSANQPQNTPRQITSNYGEFSGIVCLMAAVRQLPTINLYIR